MNRAIVVSGVIATWILAAATAQAQPAAPVGFGSSVPRPTMSPYLNIARGGDPAINYYGLVRPQVAAFRAFQVLDNNVTALQADINQQSQTGQRSSFMTQGRYFMNNNAAPSRQSQQQAAPVRPPSRGR